MLRLRLTAARALLGLLLGLPPWAGAETLHFYVGAPPAELPSNEGVPGSLYDALQGDRFALLGPRPQSIDIQLLATAQPTGESAAAELIAWDGTALWIYDPAQDLWQAGTDLPAPPVDLGALTSVDLGESSAREELVGARGTELYVLDRDAESPAWSGPRIQPFAMQALAAVDLGGNSDRRELVATNGSRIYAMDLDAGRGGGPPDWEELLPVPTFAVDTLARIDVRDEAGESTEDRLLIASASDLYARHADGWIGPFPQRFAIRTMAPIEVLNRVFGDPELIDTEEMYVVLSDPDPVAMQFRYETESSGIGDYGDPGGNDRCPGGIFADVNGDGHADLYLVRDGDNALYLGDGTSFALAPGALGAADGGDAAGAVLADYDNDGDRDIFVADPSGENALFAQQPDGSFLDVTESTDPTPLDPPGDDQEGLARGVMLEGCGLPPGGPCSLERSFAPAWADVDRDGDLDLFVGHHITHAEGFGERDVLYLNDGEGAFVDITASSGLRSGFPPGSTLAATFADLNGDGWPDLYVGQKPDGPRADELYLNDGDADRDGSWDGTFTEYFAGVEEPVEGRGDEFGDEAVAMGIDVADYDGDGDLDVFVTDIVEADLWRNLLVETGSFALERVASPAAPVPSAYWSRGAAWLDADNDADLDLYVTTEIGIPDYLYRNEGGGSFTDVAFAAGVANAEQSRGALVADADGDGWLDLLAINRDGVPAALHRNRSHETSSHHWLQLVLEGDPALEGPYRSSRDAIGARLEVTARVDGDGTAPRTQVREIRSGGHLCASTSSLVASFGLGQAERAALVRVRWPSGRISVIGGLEADQRVEISERDLFADGFESGDGAAWGAQVP